VNIYFTPTQKVIQYWTLSRIVQKVSVFINQLKDLSMSIFNFLELLAWVVVILAAIAIAHSVISPCPLTIEERRAVRIAKRISEQRKEDGVRDALARDEAIASELSHLQSKWGGK
jgi:hypothetical protein